MKINRYVREWRKALVSFSLLTCLLIAAEPSAAVTVTLLHFNDLHAHLTPHPDIVPDALLGQTAGTTKVVERGGLARLATLIKQARAQNPNTLLMNIGDTYHGGAEALYSNGNAVVDPVNALGIDVGVPGNWDFAYGPAVTRLRYGNPNAIELNLLSRVFPAFMPQGNILRPSFVNLAANVTYTLPPSRAGTLFLPPTLLTQVGGVKVGFIGIASDIVPQMYAPLAYGLSFVSGEPNYRDLINKYAADLRSQGAQIVVVMSELGIHKNYRLAQIITAGSVDVIFSAHTHEAIFTPLTSASGALVVEAGNDGYLGRMDINVDNGKVTARSWKLLPIDRNVPQDAAMLALVNTARAPFLAPNPNIKVPLPLVDQTLTRPINSVVGYTAGALDRRHALESGFNNAFTDALRKKTGTQTAMTPGFRYDSILAAPGSPLEDNTVAIGNITLEDVYRYFPVAYTVSTGTVTGARLKQIMEQGLSTVYSQDSFLHRGGWFEGFSGVSATLNLAGPDAARISDLRLTGAAQPLGSNEVVSITGCSRPVESSDTLCSYTGFSNVAPLINPATGAAWTVADIFVDALAAGTLPVATRRNLTDVSGAPSWPQTPFVQPLYILPTITGFWPGFVEPGSMVFVFGSNFIPRATKVAVNGIDAPIVQVFSDSFLAFMLPSGATAGPITLTTAAGSATSSSNFGVPLLGLQLTGIWPAQAKIGSVVFTFGSGFDPAMGKTKVTINGLACPLIHVLDPTLLLFVLPSGVTSGPVTVNVNGQTVIGNTGLTILP